MAPKRKAELKLTYLKDVTYPELERTVVHRYKKYRGSDSHYYVKCCDTIYNDDGDLCECNMEPQRDDHYKKWLKTHEHFCQPGKQVSQMILSDCFKGMNDSNEDIITEQTLFEQMAIFTGKANLPLNCLASEDFYQLSIMFIAYGLTLAKSKSPRATALKYFNRIKRDKLKYIMTKMAFQKHGIKMKQFSKLPYASIAIDEGTTSGIQNLHFVLESPLTSLKSYAYKTVQMQGGKAADYIKAIPQGFIQLNISKIKIGSIVVDGNTAQLKALNPYYKKSIFHFNNIPNVKNILIIPCLCHRIHNSYKNAVKNDESLSEIVNLLHTIADKCRMNQKVVGAICPPHVDNRWVYDFDIVKFVLFHKYKIIDIMDKDDIQFSKFEELMKCLKVLKCIVLTFENPKTKFQDAFIILERAINCLEELKTAENNEYAEKIATSLSKYTIEAKDGGLWSLAYCLTPTGRDDFRTRIIERMNPSEKSYLHYFHLNDDLDSDDDISEEDINEISYSLKDSETVLMTNNGQPINNMYLDEYEEEEDDCDFVLSESDEDSVADDDIVDIIDPNFENYFISAQTKLHEILSIRGLKEKDIDEEIALFSNYINSSDDVFAKNHLDENNYFWENIRKSFKEWQNIADVALRILSSATSEASCERAISRQRLIHSNRRKKSKKDLLDARAILTSD